MRLIDADLFKKNIAKWLNGSDPQETVMVKLDDILVSVIMEIEEQPTAFDTEKVVEQLACNSRFVDDINEHNIKCISCVIGQKTAIDIVKKGGVE